MRLGIVIEETWDFFHEIYAHLSSCHRTTLFQRKTLSLPLLNGKANRVLFRHNMQDFMRHNDVVFFEWASELLAEATHLPKTCAIVTRLHRYELYRWADQVNWDAVDKIILVSEAKRREFTARFPAQASKIVLIPEAVSLQRFRFRPKPFRGHIGMLGHLRPRKRVYDFILTFADLLNQYQPLHLHIGGGPAAGFDEYAEAIHGLVDRLNLGSHVTFYGHVAKPEEWYPKIDLLISNSYSEGLQVTPIEAMASGCYCLSHRWEGAEELFGADQLFFTSSECQEKILRYCRLSETEKLVRRIRNYARIRQNFSVDQTKLQIQRIIESVASPVASLLHAPSR